MTAPAVTIANAVVAALNAADLSVDVTFSRAYVPKFETAGVTALQGKVVPKSDGRAALNRSQDGATIQIDIGVMKRLQNTIANEVTEIDGLLDVCEEIKSVVNRQRLTDATDAICTGTAQDPMYSIEDVDGKRVFLAAITATFEIPVEVAP